MIIYITNKLTGDPDGKSRIRARYGVWPKSNHLLGLAGLVLNLEPLL